MGKKHDYIREAKLDANISVKGERVDMKGGRKRRRPAPCSICHCKKFGKKKQKRVSGSPDLVNEHVDRIRGGGRMTGIIMAAVGGFVLGGLIYYVMGYDNGYAKGRRDERLDRFRRRE
jgi:hypothetical protein